MPTSRRLRQRRSWAVAAVLGFAIAAGVLLGTGRPASGGALRAGPAASAEAKRRQILAVEEEWAAAWDASTLEHVLAEDFVHPVPQGVFLTKAENVDWFRHHPPPPGRKRHLEDLKVRLFGGNDDVGIVTGMVVDITADGQEHRTVFTDVFVERQGRWQAVNAQENLVALGTAPNPAPARP